MKITKSCFKSGQCPARTNITDHRPPQPQISIQLKVFPNIFFTKWFVVELQVLRKLGKVSLMGQKTQDTIVICVV